MISFLKHLFDSPEQKSVRKARIQRNEAWKVERRIKWLAEGRSLQEIKKALKVYKVL